MDCFYLLQPFHHSRRKSFPSACASQSIASAPQDAPRKSFSLVGVVRAEFLRARNFDYVRAARALGMTDGRIMVKHMLPNAMVATLTFLPFILSSSIVALTALDFLGLGLPPGSASLGDLLRQGKENLQAPWLGIAGFVIVALMLSLLVFVGEAVRDAFDPSKSLT
jgi:microcin C transport system permease protein